MEKFRGIIIEESLGDKDCDRFNLTRFTRFNLFIQIFFTYLHTYLLTRLLIL